MFKIPDISLEAPPGGGIIEMGLEFLKTPSLNSVKWNSYFIVC